MKELIKAQSHLPDKIEDLHKFILIGRERLNAYRAQVRAIKKLGLAQCVRKQALEDSQDMAVALLHAESKMGELISRIPPQEHGAKGKFANKLPSGITMKQSHFAQKLYENKDLINEVVVEARENEDIPTRTEVFRKAKEVKLEEKKEKKSQEFIHATESNVQIFNCKCSGLNKYVKENSVDLILTDPPYPSKFEYVWNELASFASYALKPSGFLITYCGNLNVPSVIREFSRCLEYYWIGSLYHKGPSAQRFEVNMWNRAKPILFFHKPPHKKQDVWLEDVLVSEAPDKTKHEWGQSYEPFKKLIECFSDPGQLVCDPFFGGGSVIKACAETKRNFIGCDTKEETFLKVKRTINDKA